MSDTTTEGIRIEVRPAYLRERSDPASNAWFFTYHITITNTGAQPAKLLSRHWIITNGDGKEEHVKGPGVVGKTPRLEPGHSFEYRSFCPLPTPVGTMHGTFQMVRDDGAEFDASIAPFTLAAPGALN
jgi:ApaG protein